jgi:cerevisin
VAKGANVIAVKVLSDAGSGAYSDIISGLDYVASQARASGRPSIATLSLGGPANSALDYAISSLVGYGVHVTVAAGNDNTDASNTSPARVAEAITVGASTISDSRSYFSNYGSVVDIFAPGSGITSSWIGSPTATNNISGTSMATPHVAGWIAYFLSMYGSQTPAFMSDLLKTLAMNGRLSDIRES